MPLPLQASRQQPLVLQTRQRLVRESKGQPPDPTVRMLEAALTKKVYRGCLHRGYSQRNHGSIQQG